MIKFKIKKRLVKLLIKIKLFIGLPKWSYLFYSCIKEIFYIEILKLKICS
jgi:hypothetical protein